MDRKEYLQLCQQNSVYLKSVKVVWNNIPYFPMAYQLSFNEKGEARHTAILKECSANSVMHCELSKVEPYKVN